jgi:hypothetical protein
MSFETCRSEPDVIVLATRWNGTTITVPHFGDEQSAGQRAFYHRARLNRAATLGKYTDEMEAASPSEGEAPHRLDWHDD